MKQLLQPGSLSQSVMFIILWQGGHEVNLSVLIGSMLAWNLPYIYYAFPWKQLQAEYFFVFKSWQIQNKHRPSAI